MNPTSPASTPIDSAEPRTVPTRRRQIGIALIAVASLGVVAWWRVGLLDLPGVPLSVTVQFAGLDSLPLLAALDQRIRPTGHHPQAPPDEKSPDGLSTAALVHGGIESVRTGDVIVGLSRIREGVQKEPSNLAFGNAYRMEVFRLRREGLNEARTRGELAPKFPPHLDRQPIAFFEELVATHPSRETKLQLALSWVDEMLLFPALEIKAPSSVQAVIVLTEILSEPGNEWYVPALFARGLNHLHRPARLVWPESEKTPPDAAAADIARCVAVGRKVQAGSHRLQATLAMTLGDAYVKAGRLNVARSWWQIAQNLCGDDSIQQAVRRRYGWRDEEILDRLEEELDRARAELDQPMTDLAMMWN